MKLELERDQMNRIATGLAAAGALAGIGSMFPPSAAIAGWLATMGFMFVALSVHAARPERDREPDATAYGVGIFAVLMVGVLGLVVVSAIFARFGAFLFLGSASAFIAEHFTIVTGPITLVFGALSVLAVRGHYAPVFEVSMWRRAVTGGMEALVVFVTTLVVAGAMAGEPWHAPYYLAFGMLVVYADAVWHLGLPTPARLSTALERGEADEAVKRAVSFGAFAGNGLGIALAVGALVAGVIGQTGAAAGFLLGAIIVTVLATNASSLHRKVTPLALETDVTGAQQQMFYMRVMGWVLGITALIGLIAGLTFLASASDEGAFATLAALWPFVAGAFLVTGAGINIYRARMPSRIKFSSGRRATSAILLALITAAAFFGQLQSQSLIEGPIVRESLAAGLHVTAAGLMLGYILVRGLYPFPFESLLNLKRSVKGEKGPESAEEIRARMQRTMLVVYLSAGGFLLIAVGLLSAVSLGVIALPSFGAPQGNAAFFGLLALGLLLLIGLGAMFLQSRRVKEVSSTQRVQFKRRRTTAEVVRYTMLGLSISLAVILFIIGGLVMAGQITNLGPTQIEKRFSTDFFVFGLLVGLGPAGFLYNRERNRIRAIDQRLPDFLRDLAESQRSGMTLTQAVVTSAKGNYNELTPEIKKMATQIEWGISFEDAFVRFAKRVNTPLVERSVSLIVEASKAGGNVVDILTAASDDARELYQIQLERRNSMSTYVIIIYVAFFVFLGVIGVLNAQFMPQVAKAVEGAKGATLGSITFKPFDLQAFKTLFFHASIVQAFGGGFVAGAMEEGRPVAGLRHAFVLTILAYVAFRFVIGG